MRKSETKSAALSTARSSRKIRRATDIIYAALFVSVWSMLSISPWWYVAEYMTPGRVIGLWTAIFAAALLLCPLVMRVYRKLKRPRRKKVRVTYDSRGRRTDREHLGYISADTICEICRRDS